MKQSKTKSTRILAIAPSCRGFGFAVLEGEQKLMDWGVRSLKTGEEPKGVRKFGELVAQYQPTVVVMPDFTVKAAKRSFRVRLFARQIENLAVNMKKKVVLLTRDKVAKTLLGETGGTKQSVAEHVAQQFPKELADRLPAKRRAWDAEDPRMDIFDAVALAVALCKHTESRY